jgi:hypothetical protein
MYAEASVINEYMLLIGTFVILIVLQVFTVAASEMRCRIDVYMRSE